MPFRFPRTDMVVAGVMLAAVAAWFAPASSDAEQDQIDGVVTARLASVRARIDRYRHDHGGRAPDFEADGWGTLLDPTTLLGGRYLDVAPVNPAFSGVDKTSIIVVHDAAARGSPRAAWVWNVPKQAIYASAFDETENRATRRLTD